MYAAGETSSTMTLGDGVFLSAVLLSVTALFIATKDRWNWKKIVLWPIATGAVVGAGIMLLLFLSEHKEAREREQAQAALKKKIVAAGERATSKGKPWTMSYETDPASGKGVARRAEVVSDDGSCLMSVQSRLSGTNLTALHCPGVEVSQWASSIDIKFDNVATSNEMNFERFRGGTGVYIPSEQADYLGYVSYDKFIDHLRTGKSIAMKMPLPQDDVWVRFTLKGAHEALNKLGKEIANPVRLKRK